MAKETPEGATIVAEPEDGIRLARCDLDALREQDINARVMDDAKFNQPAANIEKRGTLEQLPCCVLTDRGVEIVSGRHRARAARAAIPTTTHEGVKSIIERKMKAGGISQPWEIFENLLGGTYGARGRKAD